MGTKSKRFKVLIKQLWIINQWILSNQLHRWFTETQLHILINKSNGNKANKNLNQTSCFLFRITHEHIVGLCCSMTQICRVEWRGAGKDDTGIILSALLSEKCNHRNEIQKLIKPSKANSSQNLCLGILHARAEMKILIFPYAYALSCN